MNDHNAPLVLMADDDEDDCTLARDAYRVSKAPGSLQCVEDGIQLMDFLTRSDPLPAVILLDLNMPRKDGRQALKEIKADPQLQTIPIVILTTSREKEDMAYTTEMGAVAFFTKPAAFREWVRIMESLSSHWLQGRNA
ncbi:MAG: response regulator [Thermodesulfobacteriota bacterium]